MTGRFIGTVSGKKSEIETHFASAEITNLVRIAWKECLDEKVVKCVNNKPKIGLRTHNLSCASLNEEILEIRGAKVSRVEIRAAKSGKLDRREIRNGIGPRPRKIHYCDAL